MNRDRTERSREEVRGKSYYTRIYVWVLRLVDSQEGEIFHCLPSRVQIFDLPVKKSVQKREYETQKGIPCGYTFVPYLLVV